jgi:hypothetical protein
MIYAIIAMLPCGLLLIDLVTMVSMSSPEYHMNDTLIVVRQGYICITRDGLIIKRCSFRGKLHGGSMACIPCMIFGTLCE